MIVFVYIIRFVDTSLLILKHVHVACDVMKERTLYLLEPSSLIWHLMPYLFLFTMASMGRDARKPISRGLRTTKQQTSLGILVV